MLSSASNVSAWAKKGRDVDRLLQPGSAPSQLRFSAAGSLRSRANGPLNVSSRSIASTVSLEVGSRLSKSKPSLSQGGERQYHTSSTAQKKKIVNTKSIATQGRRQKEKSEDDVSVKLVMKPGPGAGKKVEKRKTKAELLEAQERKAEAAGSRPDGLLIHQKKQILRNTVEKGGQMPLIVDSVKKLKEAYPATFELIRYQWARMPISMRASLVTKSPDFKVIQNDPDMKPFTEWLERLHGRGGAFGENRMRLLMRRTLVGERIKLAEMWKEVDAGLAELRTEGELADLHFAPEEPLGAEEMAEYDADERKELEDILNDNVLEDPEIQLVLNYMVFPRSSIDPKGTLARAFNPNPITDVDLLTIAQARPVINSIMSGLKNQILRDMPEVIREDLQALFELSRQSPPASQPEALAVWQARQEAAKARLMDAEVKGLTESIGYAEAVAAFKDDFKVDFVPDPVALRLLIDSAEQSIDKFLPEYRALAEQYGSAVAAEIVTERSAAMEQDEEASMYDLDMSDESRPSNAMSSSSPSSSVQNDHGRHTDVEDEEMEDIYDDLLDEVDAVDIESAEIAFMPAYADKVKFEFLEPAATLNASLTPEQAKRETERYKADLDAWMQLKPIASEFATEADRDVLAAKTSEERVALLKRMMNVPDASVRQLTREMFFEYVNDVLEKTGFKDPSEQMDQNILVMAEKLKKTLAADTKIPAEEAQKVKEMIEMLEGLQDGEPLNSLPIGNPETQFNETIATLQMSKDFILETNLEMNKLEARLETLFAKSREATKRLLGNGTPESPRHESMVDLEKAFVKVYGSPTPDYLESVTAEDMMSQWATQMKEDIVMLEARTHIQRERDTVNQLHETQMASLATVSRPPTPYERDNGIYPFTSADFAEPLPVEARIYVSSSLETEKIFCKENVGKYLSLNAADLKRHLPEGFSLPLTKQEFAMTKTHDILIRQAALDAIDNLKAQLKNSFLSPHHIASSSGSSSASSLLSAASKAKSKKNSETEEVDDVPRPMLLHGYRGCGKSAVMSQVVYWARRNDWLVVSVPDGTDWLSSGVYISKNASEGTWDQPKLFVRFFRHLLDSHSDKLKQIPLKTANVKIGKNVCKTLFDVVEYGSVLENAAAQCFNVFKSEIRKVVEFPVLLAFDSYNSLYVPSRDFNDPESTTYHKQPLNPYNMTFGRLFYDAHLNPRLAYGTFIGGLTESMPVRPFIERVPRAVRGLPMTQPKYLEVPPYSMNEFTSVMEHYKHKNWVRTRMNSGSASELYIYQITSGFGNAIWDFTARL
jgi:hypothetical protein